MNQANDLIGIVSIFKHVAVIDDSFARPTSASLESELVQFWAEVSAEDSSMELLNSVAEKTLSRVEDFDDEVLEAIFNHRAKLTSIDQHVSDLFQRQDERLQDIQKIIDLLREYGFEVETFSSPDQLFEGGDFSLVLLDLYLDGLKQGASGEIARRIYSEFKAFVILMSDKPDAHTVEETFRERSRLLKGFFCFCPKGELSDPNLLIRRLEALPRNVDVCHFVHEFVLSVDRAFGGPLDDPSESGKGGVTGSEILYRSVKTLRSLALSDYAMLCELTLRDEGHPLGDYMIRLIGTFVTQQLLSDPSVCSSVFKLDKMRFNEFLPFSGDTSEALKELYASSIVETISSPWGNHPWEPVEETSERTIGESDE